jgi:hypothetical protein
LPVAQMLWGDRFGIIADPFGHVWSFVTRSRLEEVREGARAAIGSREA